MLPGFARQIVNAIVRDAINQYPGATMQNEVHWILLILPHTANSPKRNAEIKSFKSFPWNIYSPQNVLKFQILVSTL